jgi:hypothetical protein
MAAPTPAQPYAESIRTEAIDSYRSTIVPGCVRAAVCSTAALSGALPVRIPSVQRLQWIPVAADSCQQFTAGYGFDVMSWPGYSLLRDVRELIMLTWLAQNPRHLPEIDAEVGQRIAGLRGAE